VKELNYNRLRDKTTGSIVGVFIGDAMGLPLEYKSPNEIKQLFGYVDTFVSNEHHTFPNVAKRIAGTISDDSQLTLALMDSINRCKGYDLQNIVQSHIEAYNGKWGRRCGWGGSTTFAVEKMKKDEPPYCNPDGAGNGGPMKIAPFAIYCVYQTLSTTEGRFTDKFNSSLLKKCSEISTLTHGDHRCIVATYCQCRMIIRAMQDEMPQISKNIAELFISDAKYAEKHLPEWTGDILETLSSKIHLFLRETLSMSTPSVSSIICTEKSSFILNSYPLVAYCVSKYSPYRNFQYALTETINAGADADSNGAMVGAIMGAQLGFKAIPSDMVRGLSHYQKLMRITQLFAQSL